MSKIILVLAFSAICCTGQRRWAGSYSRTDSAEERVTWDDRNYERPETSTEDIRYDHRGKWPSDNLKGQGIHDIISAAHNPSIKRGEYGPRMDERPSGDPVSGIGQIERKVYDSIPDIGDKRQHDHPTSEDEYDRKKLDGPIIVKEREYYPKDNRKGEDPRENPQYGIPKIEDTHDTRQHTGSIKGDVGKAYEESPQDRSQKGFQLSSTEGYDIRQRDDINYKGYKETSEMQRPKDDRTQHTTRGYSRDQRRIVVREDDKTEDRISRGDRNGQRQSSREHEMDGIVGYDRTTVETKYEIPKIEEVHDTRQGTGNTTGDIGKAYEELPQGTNQKRFQPVSREGYDNGQKGDIHDKWYEETSETQRPKDFRIQQAAHEFIRPSDQPKIVVHQGDKEEDRISRNGQRQGSREDDMSDIAGYDRSIVESRQNQGKQYTPAHSKGDAGYGYDRQHEERLRAREYDRRREEELKQREYERRLEEEIRKKGEERDDIRIKGTRYNRKQEEEVIDRDYARRQGVMNGSEYIRREGQGIRIMVEKRGENMKGIESGRQQEEYRGSEYISQGMMSARREDVKGRHFERKNEGNPKGSSHDWRNGNDTEEKNIRRKGEERGQITYDMRHENVRRHRNMKGTDYNRRQNGETNIREFVHNTGEEIKTQHSGGRQGERSGRSEENKKGETFDREMDYVVKALKNDSRLSRDYNDGIQRTTNRTIEGYDRRRDNNRNRMTEHPLIHGVTDDSLRPMENSQRKDGSLRNHEMSQHNVSFNQRRNIGSHQRNIYHRNSGESMDANSKGTVTSSYAEVTNRYARRTNMRREESLEGFPDYKERKPRDQRTVPITDDFVNPVYSDSGIKQSSPIDQVRTISRYPSQVNNRNNAEHRTKGSNSWQQSSSDKWKPAIDPPNTYGYHPNVSYDVIVFLDDESDDETDVWNLSDQKAKEPSHIVNDEQDEYKREYRGSVINLRENEKKDNQQHRNETNITSTFSATESKRRNVRATAGYFIQESKIRLDSLSQLEEPADIHPDVEILPGYGSTRQFGQRNYNDDVIDDEVELFSEREIKVNARDYKANRTNSIGNKNASIQIQPISNRTSLQGKHHEGSQMRAFNRKDNSQDEIVKQSPSSSGMAEASIADAVSMKFVTSTSYSAKTDLSERRHDESIPVP